MNILLNIIVVLCVLSNNIARGSERHSQSRVLECISASSNFVNVIYSLGKHVEIYS